MTRRFPSIPRDRMPPGTTIVGAERMSPAFVKYHLDDGRVLHRFTRPEPFANPHDHPWPFQTEVLSGGYIEEVFTIRIDGSWFSELVTRVPGKIYEISANHIHRIVGLPAGECWTLVRAGRQERTTQFWRFSEIVQRRVWNSSKWSLHSCARQLQR